MTSKRREIEIAKISGNTMTALPAVIIRDFDKSEVMEINTRWNTARKRLLLIIEATGGELEHGHWDWGRKISGGNLDEHRIIAIVCEDSVQALAALKTGRSRLHPTDSSELSYVDFIETAPWN